MMARFSAFVSPPRNIVRGAALVVTLAVAAGASSVGAAAKLTFEAEAQHAEYLIAKHGPAPRAPVTLTTSGPRAKITTDSHASNRLRVSFDGASGEPPVPGDWIEFTLHDVPAGTYSLIVVDRGARTRGRYQASIDGASVGSPVDQYAIGTGAELLRSTAVAQVTFAAAGDHQLRFTLVGRHAAARGFQLSFDCFMLEPWTRPQITGQPASQAVRSGEDVVFVVEASGTPAPAYQWSKDGADLPGATQPRLALARVGRADAGDYAATVFNPEGAVTSARAVLTVSEPDEPAPRETAARGARAP